MLLPSAYPKCCVGWMLLRESIGGPDYIILPLVNGGDAIILCCAGTELWSDLWPNIYLNCSNKSFLLQLMIQATIPYEMTLF